MKATARYMCNSYELSYRIYATICQNYSNKFVFRNLLALKSGNKMMKICDVKMNTSNGNWLVAFMQFVTRHDTKRHA